MQLRQPSLTHLLGFTLGLLFILYLGSVYITPYLANNASQQFNQMMQLHDNLQTGYFRLRARANSIQQMLEKNLLNDQISKRDIADAVEWLEQYAAAIGEYSEKYEMQLDSNLSHKVQYLLRLLPDKSNDGAADDIQQVSKQLTSVLQNYNQQVYQSIIEIERQLEQTVATKANLQTAISAYQTNFDLTLSQIERYFKQPPIYRDLVLILTEEQLEELKQLQQFLETHNTEITIELEILHTFQKKIQYLSQQFYAYAADNDKQSDTFLTVIANLRSNLEQFDLLLQQQLSVIETYVHETGLDIANQLNSQSREIQTIMLFGLAIAVVTLLGFFGYSYKWLSQLRHLAENIAAGNFSVAILPYQRTDLFGRLVAAFNHMIISVKQRDAKIDTYVAELQQSKQTLEQEVVQRTTELAKRNHQLHQALQQKQQNEEQLRLSAMALANTSDAILITDARGTILSVNPAFCKMTGYQSDEVVGQRPNINKSNKHDAKFYADLWYQLFKTGHWSGEIINRRKNGETFPVWESINAVYDETGDISNFVGVFRDISDIKETQKQLHDLAYYDHLTRLPNRALFYEHLEHEIAISTRKGHQLALLFIDLDKFKYVNDTLGHDAGDDLLIEVSKRLKQHLRTEDIVSRQGGDEFLILLRDISESEVISSVAAKIIDSVSKPFLIQDVDVQIGCSIGISIYPDDGTTEDQLLKSGDIAMYAAKSKGRGNYQFYDESMNEKNSLRIQFERRLAVAIEQRNFQLYYQPQIDRAGKVVAAEALIRWHDSELGHVPPDNFIPIAEESGLIHAIGDQVIHMACQSLVQWRQQQITIPAAINLSAKQLTQGDFVNKLQQIVSRYGLHSSDLELEITETAILENMQDAQKTLQNVSEQGFSLAMDDFGTGFSSLSYLHKLPFDTIKIDRSFVHDMPVNESSRTIVKAIIGLAQAVNMKVAAEGVETAEHQQFLWDNHVDYCQGYYFSRPLPAAEFIRYMQQYDHADVVAVVNDTTFEPVADNN